MPSRRDYDIYLGDFLRGDDAEAECAIIALAVIGDRRFFIWSEITMTEKGYDIWMYPSPFGRPGVLEESRSHDEQIENIPGLDKLVGHIEK